MGKLLTLMNKIMRRILILFVFLPTIAFSQNYNDVLDSMIILQNEFNNFFKLPENQRDFSKYQDIRHRLESYYEQKFFAKLDTFTILVAQGDTNLMKKYIKFVYSAEGSASEAIAICLASMFINYPDVFFRSVDINKKNNYLDCYGLAMGLFNIYCGDKEVWIYLDKLFYNISKSSQDSLIKYLPEFNKRYNPK
jgi:hypothetical protein